MNKLSFLISVFLVVILTFQVSGQSSRLYVNAFQRPVGEVLVDLSLQSGINIIYSDQLVQRLPPVTLDIKNVTLEEALDAIFKNSDIGYRYIANQIVLYQFEVEERKYSISGLIVDSVSGEPLISAYVYDQQSGKASLTNEYGYFNLILTAGEVQLITGYTGFHQQRIAFSLEKDVIIQLKLLPNALLPEVLVTDERFGIPEPAQPVDILTLSSLRSDIQIGGASDLYRAADFIPGVHTGTDGVGGIHVRGGNNDQNLILMDGVPVYHPNHLLGIISVFNYQVLQQASVYKANFPSKFSGRLSSVMDVRTREGNIHKWGCSGNAGVSEFGLMAEGPLVPGKVGVLIAGRFFLPGLFMPDLTRTFKRRNDIEGFTDIDYLDFNGKINWKFGIRDRLYLSMYMGRDKFSDFTIRDINEQDTSSVRTHEEYDKNINWSNRTAVFRWNHIVNENVFSNFILSTSSFVLQSLDKFKFLYEFPGTNRLPVEGFDTKEFKSGIRDITAKIELDIRPSADHQLNAGIYGIHYLFQPKSISHNEESKIGEFVLEEGLIDDALFEGFKVQALEAGIYGEDKWEIKKGLNLSAGIHISTFIVQGIYYLDPQLRMNLEYRPGPRLDFNAGYSRMTQYLHHLTSSSIGLPTDLWVPTTKEVSPSLSDQYSVSGLWRATDNFSIDLSAYVKDMRSLISYQEGASFLLTEGPLASSIVDAGNWETKITEGVGHASGIELQAIYEQSNLQVKWNATWSRSFRRFTGINFGNEFPDRYDRRWSSTFTGQFQFNPKWSLGANFIFGSGLAITLAEGKFVNPGSFSQVLGIDYSEINAFRLPAYHRLDLILDYKISESKTYSHSLSLNLYNVYNRTNPFYITLITDPVNPFEYRQFSLFKFFPSVSYRFAFH